MYSIHNVGKSVAAERFIRTLRNKIYKYMTSASKKVYFDKLDDAVNKYNNTYHSTIKMKPADVNSSTYIDFNQGNNKEDPKFEVSDDVTISKHKNIFSKAYAPFSSEEVFVIKKVKNTVPWTYVISDINVEEVATMIYEKNIAKNKSNGVRSLKNNQRKR